MSYIEGMALTLSKQEDGPIAYVQITRRNGESKGFTAYTLPGGNGRSATVQEVWDFLKQAVQQDNDAANDNS